MMGLSLTTGWIEAALSSSTNTQNTLQPYLQVLNVFYHQNQSKTRFLSDNQHRFRVLLSDGNRKAKAVLAADLNNLVPQLQYSIVKLKSWNVLTVEEARIVFVSDMEIVTTATCELRATATHASPIVILPTTSESSQIAQETSSQQSIPASAGLLQSFTNFDSQLTQNFLSLLQSSIGMSFSDICLRVGPDQREFPCHRVILATRSRWFNSLLLNGMQESSSQVISLPHTDASIFEHIIEWIYGGSININAILAPEEQATKGARLWKLWETANYYGLDALVETVESLFISQVIQVHTFVNFWNFIHVGASTGSIAGSTANLQRLLRAYLFQNLDAISSHPCWVHLHRDLLVWAFDLGGPTGGVSFPSKTLALTRWFAHNEPHRVKRKFDALSDSSGASYDSSKRRALNSADIVDGEPQHRYLALSAAGQSTSSSLSVDANMMDTS